MHYAAESIILQKVVNRRHRKFRQSIRAALGSKGAVAIVGNAESLNGQGLGPEIDSFCVVVRINRGAESLSPDLAGTKTDVLATSLISKNLVTRARKMITLWFRGPRTVLMSPSSQFLDHRFGLVALGYILDCYPQEDFHRLYKDVGAKPSTGLMTIDMFAQFIDPDRIFLYGFDYYESPNLQTGKSSSSVHSWEIERRFVEALIPEDNIR